jgi:uncharacterized membrane protein YqjE
MNVPVGTAVVLSAPGSLSVTVEGMPSFRPLAAFLCAAIATALLIAPTTYHRLTFRRGRREKERLLRFANHAVLAGTFMLATAISLSVFVVTAVVVSDGWATLTAACVELMLLVLWYGLPLAMRGHADP